MAKPKRDPIREDRIQNEAIVDAYGPEEQAMGWYYYLEDRLRFPFQARCIAANVVSRLRKGKTVEVRSIAPEDACQSDMLVLICWQGRSLAVPYLNWPPLAGTYQPPRPSLIGIRWRKVTVSKIALPCSNLRRLTERTRSAHINWKTVACGLARPSITARV